MCILGKVVRIYGIGLPHIESVELIRIVMGELAAVHDRGIAHIACFLLVIAAVSAEVAHAARLAEEVLGVAFLVLGGGAAVEELPEVLGNVDELLLLGLSGSLGQ